MIKVQQVLLDQMDQMVIKDKKVTKDKRVRELTLPHHLIHLVLQMLVICGGIQMMEIYTFTIMMVTLPNG